MNHRAILFMLAASLAPGAAWSCPLGTVALDARVMVIPFGILILGPIGLYLAIKACGAALHRNEEGGQAEMDARFSQAGRFFGLGALGFVAVCVLQMLVWSVVPPHWEFVSSTGVLLFGAAWALSAMLMCMPLAVFGPTRPSRSWLLEAVRKESARPVWTVIPATGWLVLIGAILSGFGPLRDQAALRVSVLKLGTYLLMAGVLMPLVALFTQPRAPRTELQDPSSFP